LRGLVNIKMISRADFTLCWLLCYRNRERALFIDCE